MAAGRIVTPGLDDADGGAPSAARRADGESREARARRRAARRARHEQGRWVREVKGILALALAGFLLVALYAFDPALHVDDQDGPVGPVGLWLSGALFWAVGYAGYLFPLLLVVYGVSGFARTRVG